MAGVENKEDYPPFDDLSPVCCDMIHILVLASPANATEVIQKEAQYVSARSVHAPMLRADTRSWTYHVQKLITMLCFAFRQPSAAKCNVVLHNFFVQNIWTRTRAFGVELYTMAMLCITLQCSLMAQRNNFVIVNIP